MSTTWRPCSTCKRPILHGGKWYRCSVSTCNSGKFQLAFCSMACWDAHVPAMSHRASVYALEERVPAVESPAGAPSRVPSAPPPAAAASPAGAQGERRFLRAPVEAEPDDILIVASRLKDFVRARADFNTSADVLEVLSDLVRGATIDAIANARAEGRKTVMARDFGRDR